MNAIEVELGERSKAEVSARKMFYCDCCDRIEGGLSMVFALVWYTAEKINRATRKLVLAVVNGKGDAGELEGRRNPVAVRNIPEVEAKFAV